MAGLVDPLKIIPKLKLIWRVFSLSVIVYLGLAVLTARSQGAPSPENLATVLPRAIFAIADAAASVLVYWLALEPNRLQQGLAAARAGGAEQVRGYLTRSVLLYFLCWALNQAVVLQGLSIAQSAQSPGLLLPFMLGAAGLNLMASPKLRV